MILLSKSLSYLSLQKPLHISSYIDKIHLVVCHKSFLFNNMLIEQQKNIFKHPSMQHTTRSRQSNVSQINLIVI